MPERSRGIVVLLSDKETGELNCTTCLLCARACPCGAINIIHHKDEATKKRVLDDFIVNHTICCYCGLCEEACNFAAIKLANKYENSIYVRDDLIHHTSHLQELGRDVPYEKPVRKKPAAAAKPAAKPAGGVSAEKMPEEAKSSAETPAAPNLPQTDSGNQPSSGEKE